MTVTPPTVVVIGGGISGLAAAWELSHLRPGAPPCRVTLVEGARSPGGKIATEPFAGTDLDTGPDAFLARVPAATQLAREVGLAEDLVAPGTGQAWLWARGRLRALPTGLVLGVPTNPVALIRSRALPAAAAARAALDLVLPGDPVGGEDDVAVGELVRRRMGRAAQLGLVDPLLGGINAGHTDHLSAAVAAPQLLAAARRDRSLIRGLRTSAMTGTAAGTVRGRSGPIGRSRRDSRPPQGAGRQAAAEWMPGGPAGGPPVVPSRVPGRPGEAGGGPGEAGAATEAAVTGGGPGEAGAATEAAVIGGGPGGAAEAAVTGGGPGEAGAATEAAVTGGGPSEAGAATEGGADAVFLTVRGGLGRLVEALARRIAAIPGNEIVLGDPAAAMAANGPGWAVRLASGRVVTADAMVVACPAPAAATLLHQLSPEAAAGLRSIGTASVVLTTLAYPSTALRRPTAGSGFLVPRAEGRLLTACSWVGSKWPHLATPGRFVVRASAGRVDDERAMGMDDADLVRRLHDELVRAMGLGAGPLESRVHRWRDAFPQFDVGHLDRVAAIERQLVVDAPGVILAGAALRGVGLATCIAGGRAAAVRARELAHTAGRGAAPGGRPRG